MKHSPKFRRIKLPKKTPKVVHTRIMFWEYYHVMDSAHKAVLGNCNIRNPAHIAVLGK